MRITTKCGDCYERSLWRKGKHSKQIVDEATGRHELGDRSEASYYSGLFAPERKRLTDAERAENKRRIDESVTMLVKRFGTNAA